MLHKAVTSTLFKTEHPSSPPPVTDARLFDFRSFPPFHGKTNHIQNHSVETYMTQNMANTTTSSCPTPSGIELPEFAKLGPGVPSNVTTVYMPWMSTTENDMRPCCAPNPVHLQPEAGCYAWCEVPKVHLHNSSRDEIAGYFFDCLGDSRNGSTGRPRALGVHVAVTSAAGTSRAADGRVLTLGALGFWVLLVSGACGFAALV